MLLAHLILAHTNPNHLERLVKSLSHTDADIYIHIDKKADIEPFLNVRQLPNVYFVEKRVNVYWGAYSIVQATINGFDDILKSGRSYSYINLLSGQDYPLKSVDFINEFLQANTGKAFMEFYTIEDGWTEALPRLRKYYLTNYLFPGRHLLQKWMNAILPERKMPHSMVAVGRSQWFTISAKHARYIVDFLQSNPKVRLFFKLTWGADELIFQTILYNSHYKESLVNNNLRYIDWSKGGVSPKTLLPEDAPFILGSDKLFARKFSDHVNDPLLDLIDNRITAK